MRFGVIAVMTALGLAEPADAQVPWVPHPAATVPGVTRMGAPGGAVQHGDAHPSAGNTILPQFSGAIPQPVWALYGHLYDGLRLGIGQCPVSMEFGSNAVPITQTIVGCVDVPQSAAGHNASIGIAGYGRSASPPDTGQGAVGVYGQGLANAPPGALTTAWAFNGLVANAAVPNPSDYTGGSGYMWGIEMDANIVRLPNGSAPDGSLLLFNCIGNSTVQISGDENCMDINAAGQAANPRIHWKKGINFRDDATDVAINLGTQFSGNGTGSQSINFYSRSTAGAAGVGALSADADGNMILNSKSGALVALQTGGVTVMTATRFAANFPGRVNSLGSHPYATGSVTPAVSGCGTGAAIVSGSTDRRGQIIVGSGTVNSCVLTFTNTWAGVGGPGDAAVCNAISNGSFVRLYIGSTTPMTETFSSPDNMSSVRINYHCE